MKKLKDYLSLTRQSSRPVFPLAFLMLITLLFSACAGEREATAAYTVRQMAEVAAASQSEIPPLRYLSPEDEYFYEYLTNFYVLDTAHIVDGAVFYAGGMLAAEIAVLRTDGADSASAAADLLEDYIDRRAAAFSGYAPAESAMLENSRAVLRGDYIALLICLEPGRGEEQFLSCFTDDPAPLPPAGAVVMAVDDEVVTQETNGQPEAVTPEPNTPEPSAPTVQSNSDTVTAEVAAPEPSASSAPSVQPNGEIVSPAPSVQPDGEAGTPPPSVQSPGDAVAPQLDTPASSVQPPDASVTPEPVTPPPSASPAPPVPDVYNREAVLYAYHTGDDSGLTEKNKAVLQKCREIIAEIITDGMSDYEKELAVHDYTARWAEYDDAVHDQGPNSKPDPDNDNPYGALINRKAICTGFARSFQLLTEMLGFECIVIEGTSPGGDHAWNMIVVEGNWYCVDVTWDRTGPGGLQHNYFNRNSVFFVSTGHFWEQTPDIPVARESAQLYR